MKRLSELSAVLLFCCLLLPRQAAAQPTSVAPLVVSTETKEVQVFGIIYPARFNAAQGDEAHYHLLVWQGGSSTNALIETPADDLALHDALVTLGAQPGDNLTMAAWNQRHNTGSAAPLEKVTGSALDVRLSWESNPSGKVSNGALSIHDYVTAPSRFTADTDILPPDGTPVVVTFRVLP